jgi:hypothetical protein
MFTNKKNTFFVNYKKLFTCFSSTTVYKKLRLEKTARRVQKKCWRVQKCFKVQRNICGFKKWLCIQKNHVLGGEIGKQIGPAHVGRDSASRGANGVDTIKFFFEMGEPRLLHHAMQTSVAIASYLLQLKDRIRLI